MITKYGILKCKFNICFNLIGSYLIKAVKHLFIVVVNIEAIPIFNSIKYDRKT